MGDMRATILPLFGVLLCVCHVESVCVMQGSIPSVFFHPTAAINHRRIRDESARPPGPAGFLGDESARQWADAMIRYDMIRYDLI